MLNRVLLAGNLSVDPELRHTTNGTAVTNFCVVVQDGYGDNEVETWVDVTVWGRMAEACCKYLTRGRSVYIEGALRKEKYSARDGGEKIKFFVRADRVKFLNSKSRED